MRKNPRQLDKRPGRWEQIKNTIRSILANKELLACVFYILAILYYCLQLGEKLSKHLADIQLNVSWFFNSNSLENLVHMATLVMILLRMKK